MPTYEGFLEIPHIIWFEVEAESEEEAEDKVTRGDYVEVYEEYEVSEICQLEEKVTTNLSSAALE